MYRTHNPSMRRAAWLVIFAMLLAIIPIGLVPIGTQAAWTGFSDGTGTNTDPWLIQTAEDLDRVRDNLSAFYKLDNDIDLTDYLDPAVGPYGAIGWRPIGMNASNVTNGNFNGGFDGNGKVINGLWINLPGSDRVGLFSQSCFTVNTATAWTAPGQPGSTGIHNVTVVSDAARGGVVGKDSVGMIAGVTNFQAVRYCTVIGPIKGNNFVGGIVGASGEYADVPGTYATRNTAVIDCVSYAQITATGNAV
ncbi:MAG: hypothetical protein FWD16_08060, partial [Clostridia bacterium]|nr:hypothetical protein [Clostridia bacterium]